VGLEEESQGNQSAQVDEPVERGFDREVARAKEGRKQTQL
jgi:hypothetical protein